MSEQKNDLTPIIQAAAKVGKDLYENGTKPTVVATGKVLKTIPEAI